ncbi:MAG: dihydrolipoamide acetyltransferase family protein, partial [Candidatus Hodarchaeota archaeon]
AFVSEGEERIPLRGIRRAISQAMRRSKDTAAHFTYFDEIDMFALNELRQTAKPLAEKYGVKLTYLPLIIKCLIPALKEFPYLNASLDDEKGEIILKHYYNIGIAVDTDQGLVVPVVKNADQKGVWELAAEINDLAKRAREGKLNLEDMRDGTFTLTNIGPIGGMMATPIINWPEVAILGTTKIKQRPVVVEKDGKPEVGIRPIMYLSLSFDHRVVDGAVAARFANTMIRYMENPALLLLENGSF